MGGRVRFVIDIEILQEMLIPDAKVPLQQGQSKLSVQLKDEQAGTIVEITGLPRDSIVIKAEAFEGSLKLFAGSKGERKRADFVIVSIDSSKWIVFIETQKGNYKTPEEVVEQLKGALCFVSYCKCIGREFWLEEEFLDDYHFRFVSMVDIAANKETKKTRPYSPHIQSKGGLHDTPDSFLKIYRSSSLHFSKLLSKVS